MDFDIKICFFFIKSTYTYIYSLDNHLYKIRVEVGK